MRQDIHPKYYTDARVVCSCGESWTTGSTQKELRTDVCSECHPFYTGEQRIVDTAGQVDRFMKRLKQYDQHQVQATERQALQKQKQEERFLKQQLAALDLDDELTQVLHDATIVTIGDLTTTLKNDRDSIVNLKGFSLGKLEEIEGKLQTAKETYFAETA